MCVVSCARNLWHDETEEIGAGGDMKEELESKLRKSHSEIIGETAIEVGDGWYNILDLLCDEVKNHLDWHNGEGEYEHRKQCMGKGYKFVPQLKATQIKEKFGGLRFYTEGGDEYVVGLVAMAERLSGRICESCGSIGVKNKEGWIRTLCSICREKE